jgi:hypothetical protein
MEQPDWYKKLEQGKGGAAKGVSAPKPTVSTEDRVTAIEKLLAKHGIVQRD